MKEKLISEFYLTKEVFDLNEACKYTGFAKSTFYKLNMRKEIPFFKPGGKKIFYLRENLDDWIKRNRQPSLQEIEEQVLLKLSKKGGNNGK